MVSRIQLCLVSSVFTKTNYREAVGSFAAKALHPKPVYWERCSRLEVSFFGFCSFAEYFRVSLS